MKKVVFFDAKPYDKESFGDLWGLTPLQETEIYGV